MTDKMTFFPRIRQGPRAFHCPSHNKPMQLERWGAVPEKHTVGQRHADYGIWRCPEGERWLEDGFEWEPWDDD